jgi:hypothetical protein
MKREGGEEITWEEEAEEIGGESGVSSAMKSSEQRIRSAYVMFWEVEMVLLDGSSIVPFGAFISREMERTKRDSTCDLHPQSPLHLPAHFPNVLAAFLVTVSHHLHR